MAVRRRSLLGERESECTRGWKYPASSLCMTASRKSLRLDLEGKQRIGCSINQGMILHKKTSRKENFLFERIEFENLSSLFEVGWFWTGSNRTKCFHFQRLYFQTNTIWICLVKSWLSRQWCLDKFSNLIFSQTHPFWHFTESSLGRLFAEHSVRICIGGQQNVS